LEGFKRRGFSNIQSGSWLGANHFVFFGTESETSTGFEAYVFPDDWEYPEPDEWYPTRPGKPQEKTRPGKP
jgi:hypothetical protein